MIPRKCPRCSNKNTYYLGQGEFKCKDCGNVWSLKEEEKKYIYAYDPKIKRRVVHVVNKKGIATSLVTGHKIKYKEEGMI